jgi:hypothetical protein
MKFSVLLGAGLGGLIGAAIWAGISAATNYEIGYIAWAVGGLVGFGAIKGGASGKAMGIYAGVIALAAIFAGKVLAISFTLPSFIDEFAEEVLTPEAYEEAKRDAADFVALSGEAEYPAYMIDHGFTVAAQPEEITAEELAEFKTHSVPSLIEFERNKPGFEQWKKDTTAEYRQLIDREASFSEVAIENLGPIDILFALFGVTTAYGMVAKREEQA